LGKLGTEFLPTQTGRTNNTKKGIEATQRELGQTIPEKRGIEAKGISANNRRRRRRRKIHEIGYPKRGHVKLENLTQTRAGALNSVTGKEKVGCWRE